MQTIIRFTEKIGTLGVLVTAMGCAACFPILGVLGASIGLGILASYEGLFINKLLPIFALIALIANCWGWYTHRIHHRGI